MTIERERRQRRVRTAGAAAIAVFASACFMYEGAREIGSPLEPKETTVLVENTGIEAVAVYSTGYSARLATVMPSGSVCFELPNSSTTQRLVARPVAGGDAVVSQEVDQRPGDGWEWSIGTNVVANELSLMRSSQCTDT